MAEATAYLSLGGNLGDAAATIAEALRRLDAGGARIVARSADYTTPPWGKVDQPAFINVCAEVATDLSPHGLLRLCLETELSLGRKRIEKWGPRTIDIDVLIYDEETVDTPDLKLPHPFLAQRAFVLIPLMEIAPHLEIAGRKIGDLVAELASDGIKRLPAHRD
jgi:2-amino-4-hydroxy-6-hydroxymethyldihydropteridine diphosphokinase